MYRFKPSRFPVLVTVTSLSNFSAALYFRSGKSNNAILEFSIARDRARKDTKDHLLYLL